MTSLSSPPLAVSGEKREGHNPYAPTSIAHEAWRQVRMAFDQRGRAQATLIAAQYDRSLNMGLVQQVDKWAAAN